MLVVERIHEAAKYVPLENLGTCRPSAVCQLRDWQQADRGRAMGKDRWSSALPARLEIAVTFAGDGACEAWRIAVQWFGSYRSGRLSDMPDRPSIMKGLPCPNPRRPPYS